LLKNSHKEGLATSTRTAKVKRRRGVKFSACLEVDKGFGVEDWGTSKNSHDGEKKTKKRGENRE